MSITSGTETRVNTETANDQWFVQTVPLSDGGWIVVWESDDGQDGSFSGIYQQRYDADGNAVEDETLVNTNTDGLQEFPVLAALDDGGWVVSWNSYYQDGSEDGVYAQGFDSDGDPIGAETLVNTTTLYNQNDGKVAALDGGGWVIVWSMSDADGGGVFQQAYDANGDPVGSQTQVNTFEEGYQSNQTVTGLAGGGWVVMWDSHEQDNGGGVYQQMYNASGVAVNDETQVNVPTDESQRGAVVTPLANGGWIVTWTSYNDDSEGDLYQQVFKANGDPKGGVVGVNTQTIRDQRSPVVSLLSNGGWVVVWDSNATDTNFGGLAMQVFNADGSKRGAEQQVNSFETDYQGDGQVAQLSEGHIVVTWRSKGNHDGDKDGLFQRVYDLDGNAVTAESQINDHSTGNQSSQHIVAMDDGGWAITWESDGQDGSGYGVYQNIFHLDGVDPIDPDPDPEPHPTNGNDHLNGDNGRDTINGKGGNDTIHGKGGSDKLLGGGGKDHLFGDGGGDNLKGGAGNDVLKGGGGNDRLDGQKGNDKLTGNGGKDHFIFAKHDGKDQILDFQDHKDKLDLKGFHFHNKQQALSHFAEVGGHHNDVAGFSANGTHITIKGVDLHDIGGHDILI